MSTDNRTAAADLSCTGLAAVDDGATPPLFYGQPVDGYADEMTRRGDGVWTCDLIGCHGDDPSHGTWLPVWSTPEETP